MNVTIKVDGREIGAIGDVVSYIRHSQDGLDAGLATLRGVGTAPDGRIIALLRDGERAFNAYVAALEPSDEFKEKFKQLIKVTTAISDEGKARQTALVEEINQKLAIHDDELLGKPIGE